jgi:hypothetical protein
MSSDDKRCKREEIWRTEESEGRSRIAEKQSGLKLYRDDLA